jgi:hypothetical protein
MGETMNTDKPEKVEGMVGEANIGCCSMESKIESRILTLLVTLIALVLLTEGIIFLMPVLFPGQTSGHADPLGVCVDNLRTIDWAIMQYEAANGKGTYPTTVEELVPTFLRKTPKEPASGTYYLDTTTTEPHAVCPEGHTY